MYHRVLARTVTVAGVAVALTLAGGATALAGVHHSAAVPTGVTATPSVLVVDGVRHPASQAAHYQALGYHFLVTRASLAAGQTLAFRQETDMRAQLATAMKAASTLVRPMAVNEYVTIFQDSNGGGNAHRFDGPTIVNLTDYMMWWPTSWNDQVSSLATGSYGSVTCYQNTNQNHQRAGWSVTYGPGLNIGYVGNGYNDAFSSIWVQ